ncbi:DUF3060 domain-containing protein [Arachnia propionica]|nr:DUF3060 domain-containing protein [Arachnia propionica]
MTTISIRTGLAAAAAAALLFTGCSATLDAKPADAPAPDELASQAAGEGGEGTENSQSPAPTEAASSEGGNVIKVPGVEVDIDKGKISAPGVEVDIDNGSISAPGVEVKTVDGGDTTVEANANSGETEEASSDGTTMSGTCTEPVIISDNSAFIRLTGHCPSITVSGNNVNLGFESTDSLIISGKSNYVRGTKAGTASVESDNNNLGLEEVGELAVTGNSNFIRSDARSGGLKNTGSNNNIG